MLLVNFTKSIDSNTRLNKENLHGKKKDREISKSTQIGRS